MPITFSVVVNESLATLLSDASKHPNKHLHSLANGFESGKWRADKFESYIWDNIALSCLSHSERESLADDSYTKLVQSAKNLRLSDSTGDFGKGSELAEIILYGIMKDYYGALPVVPKIFYKQNSQDNAKGADSVHIVLNGTDFSLWYGEVKFYSSIEDGRFPEIFKSISESLSDEKMKKENRILSNIKDLPALIPDATMLATVTKHLDANESLDALKPKINIPILILHQCDRTKAATSLSPEYLADIKAYHTERADAFFTKLHDKLEPEIFLYEAVKFHIILLPVPSKADIVDRFLKQARMFRGE